jgi:hypothetical protein
MLLPVESTGLSIKDLTAQLKACIARLSGNRPVILARATYATYGATGTATLMTYTFPALSLRAGDQIRIRLYGTVTNPSAFVDLFDPVVLVTQDSGFSFLEAVQANIDHATTNPLAWSLDAALSFSVPKANGQYALQPSARPVTAGSGVSGLWPNDGLMVGGMMRLDVTNVADFSATTTGGQIVSTANTGTFLITTRNANQTTLSNAKPIMISVQITTGSFNTFTVAGGWMEGL